MDLEVLLLGDSARGLREQIEFRADNCLWILWQGLFLLPGRLSEHWQCRWWFVRAAGEICCPWARPDFLTTSREK